MRAQSEQRKLNYASFRDAAERAEGGGVRPYLKLPEGAQLFKPEAGTVLLDILPYKVTDSNNPNAKPGQIWCERIFYTHHRIGVNQDSFLCAARSLNKPCPICEHRIKVRNDDPDAEQEIKALLPKQRQLFNVINLKDPNTILIWEFSYYNFGDILFRRVRASDETDGWADHYCVQNGWTLRVHFGKEDFSGREFLRADSIDFKEREDYEADILEQTYDLDSLLVVPDYDQLKEILLQTSGSVQDAAPRSTGRAPLRRGRPAALVEEETDGEMEVEGNEAETEAPRRSLSRGLRSARSAPAVEEPAGDESLDGPDEDIVDAPPRRGRMFGRDPGSKGVRTQAQEEADDLSDFDQPEPEETEETPAPPRRGRPPLREKATASSDEDRPARRGAASTGKRDIRRPARR